MSRDVSRSASSASSCCCCCMALRMPIGIAMLLVGIVGFAVLNGPPAALSALGTLSLFLCGGLRPRRHSAVRADGQSAARSPAWPRSLRRRLCLDRPSCAAGLRPPPSLACAGFAAVSGSSVASAVTMGKVCLPEMRRYNYSDRACDRRHRRRRHARHPDSAEHGFRHLRASSPSSRSAGCCSPAFCPALLLAAIFMVTIAIWMRFKPEFGPPGRASRRERARSDACCSAGADDRHRRWSASAASMSARSRRTRPRRSAPFARVRLCAVAPVARPRKLLSTILIETVNTTALVFLILIGASGVRAVPRA